MNLIWMMKFNASSESKRKRLCHREEGGDEEALLKAYRDASAIIVRRVSKHAHFLQ